ncbi:MAG: hypothetical protein ACYSWT_05910 [Planctomycetota bacterium]|jgi:hypothetical protein
MDSTHSERPSGARRLLGMLGAIGVLVTGVFAWIGSASTMFKQPPLEAAVFLAAAALAFGLLAIAGLRG